MRYCIIYTYARFYRKSGQKMIVRKQFVRLNVQMLYPSTELLLTDYLGFHSNHCHSISLESLDSQFLQYYIAVMLCNMHRLRSNEQANYHGVFDPKLCHHQHQLLLFDSKNEYHDYRILSAVFNIPGQVTMVNNL